MSGQKSRNKGAGFERVIAKMFSDAYEMTFRRTPLSGGWAKDADVAQGDIVCVDDPTFQYCIECKKAEGWKLESLFTDKHAWFDAWWKQLMDECPEDKDPLLVFSRNHNPIFVAMPIDIGFGVRSKIFMSKAHHYERIVITTLEEFLEWDTEIVD